MSNRRKAQIHQRGKGLPPSPSPSSSDSDSDSAASPSASDEESSANEDSTNSEANSDGESNSPSATITNIDRKVISALVAKLKACVTKVTGCDPQTYDEAISGPNGEEWMKVIINEMNALLKFGTLELCDQPPGKSAIDSKWVFKQKVNADGSLGKKKARLTARGDYQQEGWDYFKNLLFARLFD